jgi:hypothetical protein
MNNYLGKREENPCARITQILHKTLAEKEF